MTHWPFVLLLALAGTSAQAAGPVYRCGSTYSQTPCAGGTLTELGDPRSAAQRAEARRMAAAERKAARSMQRERLATERKQQNAPAIASLGPESSASAPADGDGKSPGKRTTARKGKATEKARDEPFTAVVPDSRRK